MKDAKQFLIDKGVKSIGDKFTALQVEQLLDEYADQFKQKWVSVEDGLPEIVETNEWKRTNGHSKTVPVIEQGNLYFGWYNYQLQQWQVSGRSGNIQVSKWFNLPDNE